MVAKGAKSGGKKSVTKQSAKRRGDVLPEVRVRPRNLEIYRLYHVEGRSQKEIALRFQLTQSAVSKILRRAEKGMGSASPKGLGELPRAQRVMAAGRTYKMRMEFLYQQAIGGWDRSQAATHRVSVKKDGGGQEEPAKREVTSRHGDVRYIALAFKIAQFRAEFEGFDKYGNVDTSTDGRVWEAPDLDAEEEARELKQAAYAGKFDQPGDEGPPIWFLKHVGSTQMWPGYPPEDRQHPWTWEEAKAAQEYRKNNPAPYTNAWWKMREAAEEEYRNVLDAVEEPAMKTAAVTEEYSTQECAVAEEGISASKVEYVQPLISSASVTVEGVGDILGVEKVEYSGGEGREAGDEGNAAAVAVMTGSENLAPESDSLTPVPRPLTPAPLAPRASSPAPTPPLPPRVPRSAEEARAMNQWTWVVEDSTCEAREMREMARRRGGA